MVQVQEMTWGAPLVFTGVFLLTHLEQVTAKTPCHQVFSRPGGEERATLRNISYLQVLALSKSENAYLYGRQYPINILRNKYPGRIPAAPKDSSLPLLSFDPGGVRKALPRRSCPDVRKHT
jgi:hypothetical protein